MVSINECPMSSSYIVLSDDEDDDVQIINETVQINSSRSERTSASRRRSTSRRPSCNAVERLSRNSSIELTINLEDIDIGTSSPATDSVKKVTPSKPSENLKQDTLEKEQNASQNQCNNGNRSDSDVEIIEENSVVPPESMVDKHSAIPSNPILSQLLASKIERRTTPLNGFKSSISIRNTSTVPSSSQQQISKHFKIKTLSEKGNNVLNPSEHKIQIHLQSKILFEEKQTEPSQIQEKIPKPLKTKTLSEKSETVSSPSQQEVQKQLTSKTLPEKKQTGLLSTPESKSPSKVDEDVICILDDDDDDDDNNNADDEQKSEEETEAMNNSTETNMNSERRKSYTEDLVQRLRKKIDKEKQNSSLDNLNGKKLLMKKRLNPDRMCADPALIKDSQFRVTRSSLSGPPSSASPSLPQPGTSRSKPNAFETQNETLSKYSIENMFSGLIKVCKKILQDDALEPKLWRYFKQASEKVLRSEEFINALKYALKTAEECDFGSIDDKLLVYREIKEVVHIMKRHPEVVDRKVKKLTKMLNILRNRIRKLEECEVTSDEEEENPYILLDRYRTRAAKIYDKLSELQGTPSDAGRVVRQRFKYQGSGYSKIDQALEKFYMKTKSFPDFFDVRTIVEKTVKKENLDIPPHGVYNIAQTIFLDFGNKLKRMRCCDEYSILNDYLNENEAMDPASKDPKLYESLQLLDSTKKIRESEQKIMAEFVYKQSEQRCKEDAKTEESDGNEASEDEGDLRNNNDKGEELGFSDTEEELMTDEVNDKKRKKDSDEEESSEENSASDNDEAPCSSQHIVKKFKTPS